MLNIGTLSYLGIPNWQQTSQSDITMDDYGVDSMTRYFDVRPDQVNAFRSNFQKGKVDSVFPDMAITGRHIGNIGGGSINLIGGPMCKCSVTYKGCTLPPSSSQNKNQARNLKIDFGMQLLNVTIRSLSNPDRTLDISYRAPWTSYKYVTTADPAITTPLYVGKLIQNQKNAIIESVGGDISAGDLTINTQLVQPGAQPPAAGGQFEGLLKISNKKFEGDQFGNMYAVEEVNQLLLVDATIIAVNNAQFGW